MKLEPVTHREVSQKEKNKYNKCIYMESSKTIRWTYCRGSKKTCREWICRYSRGGREWNKWRKDHQHAYTIKCKMDSRWEVRCGPGSPVWAVMTGEMGWGRAGRLAGRDVCVIMADVLCCRAETNTTLWKNFNKKKMPAIRRPRRKSIFTEGSIKKKGSLLINVFILYFST